MFEKVLEKLCKCKRKASSWSLWFHLLLLQPWSTSLHYSQSQWLPSCWTHWTHHRQTHLWVTELILPSLDILSYPLPHPPISECWTHSPSASNLLKCPKRVRPSLSMFFSNFLLYSSTSFILLHSDFHLLWYHTGQALTPSSSAIQSMLDASCNFFFFK